MLRALARSAAPERRRCLTEMIAGERHLALNSLLPSGASLNHRRRVSRRLDEQCVLAAHGVQRVGGLAQLRPRGLNVDQPGLAEQACLHIANGLAGVVGPRRVLGEHAAGCDQLVEQVDQLSPVRVRQTSDGDRQHRDRPDPT
jgi:hypothetical protein